MHGLLRRLFAPRWQHPDPEVRRKALHQLDPQQTEQREALHTLANDSDSTIQLAALLALDDLNGLLVAYEQHSQDEAWFNAVCQRLTGAGPCRLAATPSSRGEPDRSTTAEYDCHAGR